MASFYDLPFDINHNQPMDLLTVAF